MSEYPSFDYEKRVCRSIYHGGGCFCVEPDQERLAPQGCDSLVSEFWRKDPYYSSSEEIAKKREKLRAIFKVLPFQVSLHTPDSGRYWYVKLSAPYPGSFAKQFLMVKHLIERLPVPNMA